MPQFDPTLFAPQIIWLIIAFGFLWLLLARIGLPRVEQAMIERAEKIESDLEAARVMKAEADALTERYEASLSDARAKAAAIAEKTKADIRARTEKVLGETEEELDKILVVAQERIEAEQKEVMADMETIAAEVAANLVQLLIDQVPAENDIKAAIGHVRAEAA